MEKLLKQRNRAKHSTLLDYNSIQVFTHTTLTMFRTKEKLSVYKEPGKWEQFLREKIISRW